MLSGQTRRVTTATPEVTRERSNERALAEARCPLSVPSGVRPCAQVGYSPSQALAGPATYGWQLIDVFTSSPEPDELRNKQALERGR